MASGWRLAGAHPPRGDVKTVAVNSNVRILQLRYFQLLAALTEYIQPPTFVGEI